MGRARPCDSSALWKLNSSSSSVGGNSTRYLDHASIIYPPPPMFSNASVAEDEGELTDPGEGEEAFVSLTPAFLASTAESAISVLVARATSRVRGSTDPSRPHVRAPAARPTVRQILSHLKNDEMWPNLPQFVASGTLAVHKCEGRAWRLMYGINVCATKAGWMRSVGAVLSVCVDYHGAPSLATSTSSILQMSRVIHTDGYPV
ncbi:hypothetical protein DFH06DRAFT_115465 [Mycena polygramma]|nr:hypothetical protein DFH06DRAFT_115465 [Mycena polygramma]